MPNTGCSRCGDRATPVYNDTQRDGPAAAPPERKDGLDMRNTIWNRAAGAALCLALLAGCAGGTGAVPAAAPETAPQATAAPAPEVTPEVTPAPTPADTPQPADGYTTAGLDQVLNGCIVYGAGSAGTSLKAGIAANGLVRYLAGCSTARAEEIRTDAAAWYKGLDADGRERIDANWPGILGTARMITGGSEEVAGLLESAGVDTDFTGVDLAAADSLLDELDAVFSEPQG